MLVYKYKHWENNVLQPQRLISDKLLSLTEVQKTRPYTNKIYLEAIIDV